MQFYRKSVDASAADKRQKLPLAGRLKSDIPLRMSALVSWSGGKDACMALHRLRQNGAVQIAGLVTTFAQDPDRVGVHEVGIDLVRLQAASLGLRLIEIFTPAGATNAEYEAALEGGLTDSLAKGIDTLAFGDLFLEDIRAYRDGLARKLRVQPIYPVWGEPTAEFARAVIAAGFKAIVCSVDTSKLPLRSAGRDYDEAFLSDLPPGVDPCGENGEFHTFVYDGPGFARPVLLTRGQPEMREWLGCCPLAAA